ncbi:hypothetical protein IMG5_142890, partial [Ichthyophthirius multifiliis]
MSIEMNGNQSFEDKIKDIIRQTSSFLTCDKTCISINEGLIGQCFTNGKCLNIQNAYNDVRFSQNIDKQVNYKSNTLLLQPIFDKEGFNIIGVIQSINKLNGYFDKDDEIIIQIISKLIQKVQQCDKNIHLHKLIKMIKDNTQLQRFFTLEEFIYQAESKLQLLFNVQKGKIFIIQNNQIIKFNYLNEKNYEKQIFDINMGIVGQTYKQKQMLNIKNAYNNQFFNLQIDIESQMPIISIPVYNN